jgi:hypothetical protein
MKAQTQVINFMLYLVISISIFAIVSNYIFSFSQSSKDRLLSYFRELLSSYTSAFLIYTYAGCKYCNYSKVSYGIPYQVFDNFHEISATNNLIYIRSMPLQKQTLVSSHNLNLTVNFIGFYSTGETYSFHDLNKTSIVNFYFNKTENKFKIGG